MAASREKRNQFRAIGYSTANRVRDLDPAPRNDWEILVKRVRLTGLAASTALGLTLALSSQSGYAQSTSGGEAQVIAPIPADAKTPAKADTAAQPAETPAKTDAAAQANKAPADTDTTAAIPSQTPAPADTAAQPAEPPAQANTAAQPAETPAQAETAAQPAETPAKADTAAQPADTAVQPANDVAQTAPKAQQALPKIAVPLPDAAAPTEKDVHIQPTEAAPSKAASAPPAGPSAADLALAGELKSLLAGRLDRFVTRRDDRAGVEAFYKKRDYKPLWVNDGAADARAKAAIAYLAAVETDGLNPDDYPTPAFKAGASAGELAADELKLTNAVLVYARDAEVGRINYTRIGSDISFKLDPPDPAAVLAKMADTKDVAAALDGYNPPQAGFKALKAKLAELRKGALPKEAEKAEGHAGGCRPDHPPGHAQRARRAIA